MTGIARHRHTVRRHVRIFGRVQGVYFRRSIAERAELLGIDGWVRNLPDGSVDAAFEGPAEQVDRMIAFCRSGPPAARVDEIRVEDSAVVGARGFGLA